MATNDIPTDNSSSLGGLSISDDDIQDDEALQSDTWIEELECALLADCDPATLKKICEGKRIPTSLRPDYWRTLLALNDAGKVKLSSEYDLHNQNELRADCEQLVKEVSSMLAPELLPESEKLRLKSDFESTLTTYVKARPELDYVSGNGWTDILKVLYHLQLNNTQMYQMFFRIVDRYIPKGLSPSPGLRQNSSANEVKDKSNETNNNIQHVTSSQTSSGKQQTAISAKAVKTPTKQQQQQQQRGLVDSGGKEGPEREKSTQAYHLLRLLIQYHDPELCSILDSKKVTPNLYVKDWFCSLFARSCQAKLALHMWDMHFKMADPFLIFFAAIVMVVNASDELKKSNLSQADMLNALKRMPSLLEEDDIEDLYYLVSNHYTNSTPRSIRSYSHLFFMDTFGATYMGGSNSPELDGSSSMIDLKTSRLTSSLDLSRYLCLPIVPAEIFALDTAAQRASPANGSSPTNSASQQSDGSPSSSTRQQFVANNQTLRYFLVDCRPAEQYNAGHLTRAFHLDCSLMLREPSSFATAVQALLEIQRQVVASKSNTGGQHLCFIGSGQDEEDRYVNMVVASFLQKYQKYVSIVFGGFDAIHDYVKSKRELKDSFEKYIADHNEELCKACCSRSPEAFERFKANAASAAASKSQQQQLLLQSGSSANSLGSSAQSLFATTTGFFKGDKSALSKFTASNPQATATAQQLAQSGASMFDKFTTAFVSKSSVFKDRLVETLNSTSMPTATISPASGSQGQRSHVSSQDRLGPRYTGGSFRYEQLLEPELTRQKSLDSNAGDIEEEEGPCQEVQLEQWRRENDIMALYKCAQIKGSAQHPGFIGLNRTHLWILREIPHNKGFASIAAKRPLDMVVQVTSKRRQPDLIIFRYGYTSSTCKSSPSDLGRLRASEDLDNHQMAPAQAEPVAQFGESQRQGPSKSLPTIIATDHLHIPQAFEVIRLIKREIVRIMDEASRRAPTNTEMAAPTKDDTGGGGGGVAAKDESSSGTALEVPASSESEPLPGAAAQGAAAESETAQRAMGEQCDNGPVATTTTDDGPTVDQRQAREHELDGPAAAAAPLEEPLPGETTRELGDDGQ